MTSERTPKTFDCVENMREVRDRLSAEIGGMSHNEMVLWLRGHRYADPVLQSLAEKAAQRAAASDSTPAGR